LIQQIIRTVPKAILFSTKVSHQGALSDQPQGLNNQNKILYFVSIHKLMETMAMILQTWLKESMKVMLLCRRVWKGII